MKYELPALFLALGMAVGAGAGILIDGRGVEGAAIGMLVGFITGLVVERKVMQRRAERPTKDAYDE